MPISNFLNLPGGSGTGTFSPVGIAGFGRPQYTSLRDRGYPEMLQEPVNALSRGAVDVYSALGRYPVLAAETPIALAGRLLSPIFGRPNEGEKPYEAPGFLMGALNFSGALANEKTYEWVRDYGDKPDAFVIPTTIGVPGHKPITMGEIRNRVLRRGGNFDIKTGETLEWDELVRRLKSGQLTTWDFGHVPTDDNDVVDFLIRGLLDPTNYVLFGAPSVFKAVGRPIIAGWRAARAGETIGVSAQAANALKGASRGWRLGESAGRMVPDMPLFSSATKAITSYPPARTMAQFIQRTTGWGVKRTPMPFAEAAKTIMQASVKGSAQPVGLHNLARLMYEYPLATPFRAGSAIVKKAVNVPSWFRSPAEYLKGSASLQLTMHAVGQSANAVDSILNNYGMEDTPFDDIRQFVNDVERDAPLSDNVVAMLGAAMFFPYGEVWHGAKLKAAQESVRVHGTGYRQAMAEHFYGKSDRATVKLLEDSLGGPENLDYAIIKTLYEIVRDDAQNPNLAKYRTVRAPGQEINIRGRPAPQIVERIANEAELALHNQLTADYIIPLLHDAIVNRLITPDDFMNRLKFERGNTGAFGRKGASPNRQVEAPEPLQNARTAQAMRQLEISHLRAYNELSQVVGAYLGDQASRLVLVQRKYLWKHQIDSLERDVVEQTLQRHGGAKAALNRVGSAELEVPKELIMEYLERYPALGTTDTTGRWIRWGKYGGAKLGEVIADLTARNQISPDLVHYARNITFEEYQARKAQLASGKPYETVDYSARLARMEQYQTDLLLQAQRELAKVDPTFRLPGEPKDWSKGRDLIEEFNRGALAKPEDIASVIMRSIRDEYSKDSSFFGVDATEMNNLLRQYYDTISTVNASEWMGITSELLRLLGVDLTHPRGRGLANHLIYQINDALVILEQLKRTATAVRAITDESSKIDNLIRMEENLEAAGNKGTFGTLTPPGKWTDNRRNADIVDVDEALSYIEITQVSDSTKVDAMAETIKKEGFDNPIVMMQGADGSYQFIDPYQVMAAKSLGMSRIPVTIMRNQNGRSVFSKPSLFNRSADTPETKGIGQPLFTKTYRAQFRRWQGGSQREQLYLEQQPWGQYYRDEVNKLSPKMKRWEVVEEAPSSGRFADLDRASRISRLQSESIVYQGTRRGRDAKRLLNQELELVKQLDKMAVRDEDLLFLSQEYVDALAKVEAELDEWTVPIGVRGLQDTVDEATYANMQKIENDLIMENSQYRLGKPADPLMLTPAQIEAISKNQTFQHLIRRDGLMRNILFDEGPIAGITHYLNILIRPMRGSVMAASARQALYDETVPKGFTAREIDKYVQKAQMIVEHSRIEPGGLHVRFFSDVAHLPQSTLNSLALEMFGPNHPGIKALGGIQMFATVFDKAMSRYYRNVTANINRGGWKGRAARAADWAYRTLQVKYKNGVPSPRGTYSFTRFVGKNFYFWFRFVADPRWHALNMTERYSMMLLKKGIARDISNLKGQITPEGRYYAHQMLRGTLADATDTGWYLGRPVEAALIRGFNKDVFDSTYQVLDSLPYNWEPLKRLRDRWRQDLDDRLASGSITDKQYANEISHVNESLSRQLERTMYEGYDKKGVKKTIMDAAHQILSEDEVNTLGPLLQQLYERNAELWRNMNRMLIGNPSRRTIERIANSFWLYWPISYQIKAMKWMAGVMLDGTFGHNTHALAAAKYATWKEQHLNQMATNPDYALFFSENQDLWFMAQMLLPIVPWDMGVTLSRPARAVGSWVGAFEDYAQAKDPWQAFLWNLQIGPVYTYNLLSQKIVPPISRWVGDLLEGRQGGTRLPSNLGPSTYQR